VELTNGAVVEFTITPESSETILNTSRVGTPQQTNRRVVIQHSLDTVFEATCGFRPRFSRRLFNRIYLIDWDQSIVSVMLVEAVTDDEVSVPVMLSV